MAITRGMTAPNYADRFRQHVSTNIQYWQVYVRAQQADVAALDAERESILKAITFALDLPAVWPHVYDLIETFSPYMERRGYWESWNRILIQALGTAGQVNDTAGGTTLSTLLARLFQRQGHPRRAIAQYRRTIRLARQTGNHFEEARALSNLGYLYTEHGQWCRAEVLCRHALQIFEEMNSDHGRAHTKNHLGVLFTRQGRYEEAECHLNSACEIWQAMEDDHGLMRGLINLSSLYIEGENGSEALKQTLNAVHQARLTGEESELGTIYLNMGVANRIEGELAQAETCIRQAEAIFRQYTDQLGVALAWISLGTIYTDQKKWPEAREYLEAALELCRGLKNDYCHVNALMSLVEYELTQRHRQGAAARLRELEQFIHAGKRTMCGAQLQGQLEEYHRNLSELSASTLRQNETTFD